ncbi:ArsR/SmtB family transcription factor [Peptoniphilus raoultii]|uniref:ArsR/SmtB family transcription factor n=1 Tax=Peptoniphilus raoultii TaxID=1776387 RepID=UPI0009F6334F|nr:metalloregulator ArsR/SmtB family transcription factor [Peptoniphilus raoultii]
MEKDYIIDDKHIESIKNKAKILKVLSHPIRLCVLDQLIKNGEKNVSEIIFCMGIGQSNLSQHLSKLKDLGIIEGIKEGNQIYYGAALQIENCYLFQVKRTLKRNIM